MGESNTPLGNGWLPAGITYTLFGLALTVGVGDGVGAAGVAGACVADACGDGACVATGVVAETLGVGEPAEAVALGEAEAGGAVAFGGTPLPPRLLARTDTSEGVPGIEPPPEHASSPSMASAAKAVRAKRWQVEVCDTLAASVGAFDHVRARASKRRTCVPHRSRAIVRERTIFVQALAERTFLPSCARATSR